MISELLKIFILTITPIFELRASIPYAVLFTKIPLILSFIFIVILNILIGLIVYFFLKYLTELLITNKYIKKIYDKTIERVHKKTKKLIDKYGELGLALFIAIPLPGSGVYSGALAAYIFGIKTKKFFIAESIGVFVAASIVTILSLLGLFIL